MKTQKIKKFNQFIAVFFCLAILTQNGVEAPVLCFETDGHINFEAVCDISCKISVPENDEHQDECDNCFDIHLWNYNPDLTFINNPPDVKIIHNDYAYVCGIQDHAPPIATSDIPGLENHQQLPLPPLLKHAILLI